MMMANNLIVALLLCIGAMADILGPISENMLKHLHRKPKRYEPLLRSIAEFGETGSFGGKMFSEEKISNTPIIFIHGNSDSALKHGEGKWQSGWDEIIKYFQSKDYTLAEMYGITYGDRNISTSYTRHFNCETLTLHRRFVEFVLHYTQSPKVHIIGHSMGASIARKVIQGGEFSTKTEACDLGPNISDQVGTLIALASANYGMCPCQNAFAFPACSMDNGFYPGTCLDNMCGSNHLNISDSCSDIPYSRYLMSLNQNARKDADVVASLWSNDDEIIGPGGMVWGRLTSLVPHSDIKKVYQNINHNEVKLLTAADQYDIIRQYDDKFTTDSDTTMELF